MNEYEIELRNHRERFPLLTTIIMSPSFVKITNEKGIETPISSERNREELSRIKDKITEASIKESVARLNDHSDETRNLLNLIRDELNSNLILDEEQLKAVALVFSNLMLKNTPMYTGNINPNWLKWDTIARDLELKN